MYILDDPTIDTWDLQNKVVSAGWASPNETLVRDACLASTKDYLFSVGGTDGMGTSIATVHTLRMPLFAKVHTTTMNRSRERFSCIVDGAIGGIGGELGGYFSSIERAPILRDDIGALLLGTFEDIGDLELPASDTRAVYSSYSDKIFVIGGRSDDEYRSKITVISSDGTATVTGDDLIVRPMAGVAAVAVGQSLYAFGGITPDGYTDDYTVFTLMSLSKYKFSFMCSLYAYISRTSPTAIPTQPPTTDPTIEPSLHPSIAPIMTLTSLPTVDPTEHAVLSIVQVTIH